MNESSNRASTIYISVTGKLIWALGRIGSAANSAIPEIINEMRGTHYQRNGAIALSRIGKPRIGDLKEAKSALPKIIELRKSKNFELLKALERAVENIGEAPAKKKRIA
jgi:hypothetical protein